MTRVLLAVDSEMLRPRLHEILSEITGVEIVHDVTDIQGIEDEILQFKPDVVILSLLKLSQTSIRLASLLRGKNPTLPLIALTGPFTSCDETLWKKEGVDHAFNITNGAKALIDYVTICIVPKTATGLSQLHHLKTDSRISPTGNANLALPDRNSQSQSKYNLHESESKSTETR